MSTKRKSAVRYLEKLVGPLRLGKLLQSIRLAEELGLADFADKLNISKSHLCDIEKGRKSVSPERAVAFADILHYSQEQFVRLSLQELVDRGGLEMVVRVEAV